jgi:C4-dicarboxylate-specific signal transduction histidine kinase
LIKNSLQSLKENRTKNPEIIITLSDDTDRVSLSIQDNGPGISKEVKNHVFEPKFTTKTKGMGLGLAMVKTIVLSYRGTIDIHEPKHGGVAFVMQFPKG